MVGKEDLGNAIAMNSLMFNLGTAVGPAVSGIVYAFFGPGWCFFINGVSYIFIIIALMMMKLPKHERKAYPNSSLSDIMKGLRYAFSHEVIKLIIFSVAFVTLFAFSFMTLLPAWPEKVFGIADPKNASVVNGLLQSFRGIGALSAALVAAALGAARIKGKMMFWSQMLFPVLLIAFAVTKIIPLSYAFILVGGFFLLMLYNMSNVLVQTHVEDSFRGRVMGLYNLAFMGLIPFGGLLSGTMAKLLTPEMTVLVSACICLAFVIILNLFNPKLRQLQ
jgi:MFS family permease